MIRAPRGALAGYVLAANLALAALPAPVAAQIVGRVIDEHSNGVPAAAVRVVAGDTLGLAVLTDSAGNFRIPGAPLGEIRLEVTAFGFGGASRLLDYRGEDIAIDLRVTRDPVELEGLSVEVEPRRAFLERTGFYRRSRGGSGDFLDFDAEPPRPTYRTGQLLQRVPGIVVRAGEPLVSRAQMRSTCLPMVIVDDILVRDGGSGGFTFEQVAPPPEAIAAIEVYKSGAFAPVEWRSSSSGCGVIAIWTKR
jgi:hypothetical protein